MEAQVESAVSQAERDEAYRSQFAKARHLSWQLLAENGIKPNTKTGLKLAYAVYHGVFEGNVPAGITLLFMAARHEMLIERMDSHA